MFGMPYVAFLSDKEIKLVLFSFYIFSFASRQNRHFPHFKLAALVGCDCCPGDWNALYAFVLVFVLLFVCVLAIVPHWDLMTSWPQFLGRTWC